METLLFKKLAQIVLARGLAIGNVGRYQLVTVWDGGARWDTSTQGPVPTQQQIDAVLTTPDYDAAVRVRERTRDLALSAGKALARAVHVRFGRPDAATMSAATWKTILEAAWDAENS